MEHYTLEQVDEKVIIEDDFSERLESTAEESEIVQTDKKIESAEDSITAFITLPILLMLFFPVIGALAVIILGFIFILRKR